MRSYEQLVHTNECPPCSLSRSSRRSTSSSEKTLVQAYLWKMFRIFSGWRIVTETGYSECSFPRVSLHGAKRTNTSYQRSVCLSTRESRLNSGMTRGGANCPIFWCNSMKYSPACSAIWGSIANSGHWHAIHMRGDVLIIGGDYGKCSPKWRCLLPF